MPCKRAGNSAASPSGVISSWSPGQLENELHANGWLHGPADNDLIFSRNLDDKYERALLKLGVGLQHLVAQAGHA